MAALKLSSTADLGSSAHLRIMLYGANGTGKTHFAGTWPRPVFMVPSLGSNEMRTLADQDLLVVEFADMKECAAQTLALYKAIKKDQYVGGMKPRTIIIDNLSTMQTLFEYELKGSEKSTDTKHKMTWDDWSVIRHNVYQMLVLLHKLPVHIIWIAHAKLITTTSEIGGKKETITEGGFYLSGDTKNSVPSNCDCILYAETVDRGARGPAYYIHGRKKSIWPARVRATSDMKTFDRIGPDPKYNDLVPLLGVKPFDKEETDEFYK